MEKRTDSPYPRLDRPVLAVIGFVLVIATILFLRNDREHEWRWYQHEFKRLVAEKYGQDLARTVPSGMQQIWVPAMGRDDRCVICHQATNWKGFETADHPFRTHPQEILRTHPPETYGCSSCHGGQGFAVDQDPAHGPVHFWEERARQGDGRGLLDRGGQGRADADELQRLPPLRLRDEGRTFAAVTVTEEMIRVTGARPEHTDRFINYPRSIRGIEVAIFFRQLDVNRFKVGFRSKGKIDVGALSREFGGGGHHNAAGAVVEGNSRTVRDLVFSRLGELLAATCPGCR